MIVAENIVKSYHGEDILKELSLTVNDGEFVVILGASGSGKSTLLSVLSGLEKMNSGKIVETYKNDAQKSAYEIGW